MKKSLLLILSIFYIACIACAQPKFAAKVRKGMFSLNTYDKQGKLLQQGVGFYVGENGEALADFRVFKGAYKAIVVGADGKQTEVECVLGADDTYSQVRFHVPVKAKVPFAVATSVQPLKSTLYVLRPADGAALQSEQVVVEDTSLIQGKYAYYGLDRQLDAGLIGSPVFNASGVLVGILHSTLGNKSYVLDARFCETLKMVAIPTNSASVALNNIFLPKALPDTAEEALVYLYIKSRSAENEEYMDMVNRFVAAFPRNAEGYLRRATPLIDLTRFDEAAQDMEKYLSLVEDKAAGYYNVASLIFDKLRLQPEPAYDQWTLAVAQQYVDKAISLNAVKPANDQQKEEYVKCQTLKAQILMEGKDYNAAITLYEGLLQEGGSAAPAYLYAISMAREGRGDSLSAVVEPLDSALVLMGTPMPRDAANYIIRRGQLYANAGKYREAVLDYTQYAYLLEGKVSAVFYYERSQIEVNARMFQQALDDISKAIEMAPRMPLYHVERAAITIRVGMLDECIESCQQALRLNPDIIDAYRILGYAQLQKGERENARQNIQRAIDMGDSAAQKLMETYFQ
jgi:tetratricopeptide (TPR) repeat protein